MTKILAAQGPDLAAVARSVRAGPGEAVERTVGAGGGSSPSARAGLLSQVSHARCPLENVKRRRGPAHPWRHKHAHHAYLAGVGVAGRLWPVLQGVWPIGAGLDPGAPVSMSPATSLSVPDEPVARTRMEGPGVRLPMGGARP